MWRCDNVIMWRCGDVEMNRLLFRAWKIFVTMKMTNKGQAVS
jgi:hypothetical protein